MPSVQTEKILDEVEDELMGARAKSPKFTSLHQGWAIIHEETDELWECIRGWHPIPEDSKEDVQVRVQWVEPMRAECVQIAAMAIRFIEDLLEETDA